MKLNVARSARYSLASSCTCPKVSEGNCGIMYRSG
jgi:hypothetical protein